MSDLDAVRETEEELRKWKEYAEKLTSTLETIKAMGCYHCADTAKEALSIPKPREEK